MPRIIQIIMICISLVALIGSIGYVARQSALDAYMQKDMQRNLVEQPAKPTLYIISDGALFEKKDFLYFSTDISCDGVWSGMSLYLINSSSVFERDGNLYFGVN